MPQSGGNTFVPRTIVLNLETPERHITLRCAATMRTSMPKASIDEQRHFQARPNEIRRSTYSPLPAKTSQFVLTEYRCHKNFGCTTAACTHGCHDARTDGLAYMIHRVSFDGSGQGQSRLSGRREQGCSAALQRPVVSNPLLLATQTVQSRHLP
jgi:hypothetical protein